MVSREDLLIQIEEVFSKNIEVAKESLNFLEQIKHEKIDSDFLRAVRSISKVGYLDIYDAYLLMLIDNLIQEEIICIAAVNIGDNPLPSDCEKEDELLNPLSAKYEAVLRPTSDLAKYNDDGYFILRRGSIMFQSQNDAGGFTVSNYRVPLLKGKTDIYTTFLHIIFDGGVARMEHNSDKVYLFSCLPKQRDVDLSRFSLNPADYSKWSLIEHMIYESKSDLNQLIQLLEWINTEVSEIDLPKVLFLHYDYQLGVAMHDFKRFDLSVEGLNSFTSNRLNCINDHDKYSSSITFPPKFRFKVKIYIDNSNQEECLVIKLIVQKN